MKHTKVVRGLIIVGTLLMAMSTTACGILPKEEPTLAPPLVKPKEEDYDLFKVKKGDISMVVKGIGIMVPINQIPLSMKEGGHRLKGINVQSGQEVKKGTVIAEMDSGNLPNKIKIQEFSLQIAQDDLKMVQDAIATPPAAPGHTPTATELHRAQLNVYKEQESLNQLKDELYSTRVTSPINGQVTFVENFQEGDIIGAYVPIAKVADISKLQISFESSDAGKIKLGMPVAITYGDTKYIGTVVMLPNPSEKNTDKKNAITINSDKAITDLKLGASVDIEITVQKKQNTLIVPKSAVQSFVGSYMVEVMDGAKKMDLSVEIGIQTPTEVEILSGLEEGQMVILK